MRKFEAGPAGSGAKRISVEGGSHPKWRRDGQELFYLSPGSEIDVGGTGSSRPQSRSAPAAFPDPGSDGPYFLVSYAVAANGERFLVNTPAEQAQSGPVTIIANWNPDAKR